jgi:prefoldin subunit 5/outer membrane biosynthesis protein TonB
MSSQVPSQAPSLASAQEEPLRAQIHEAEEQLGGLEQSLETIDGELAALTAQRDQYQTLAHALSSLEQLNALGATDLFWGEQFDQGRAAEHCERIRQRLDSYRANVTEVEARRRMLSEEILDGQDVLATLETDLDEILRDEEERRNEWIVEREMSPPSVRPATMPWAQGGEDDRRLRKSLGALVAASLLLGMLLPRINLPVPERAEMIEVPERLVQLIRRERPAAPPPQPVIEEPAPEQPPPPEPEPPPEPQLAEQPPQPVPPASTPVPEEPPQQRAEASGILAFRESFSTLAENRPSARLGADAQISSTGDLATGSPQRSMVSTQAPGSSGGINIASLSRDVGGGAGGGPQIAGVQTTRVASGIGPAGGGDRPLAGSAASAGRTDEEIQIVFDRYKAALYRLYNRELRIDPTLRGQVVLRLTIEPDGSVSMLQLHSTDMDAPGLVQQVIERVRTFDFGAKDVAAITIVYPIDFLPAM